MDAGKIKKLQDYASFLVKQAESKESHGNKSDAARDYVKLVDIYLLLANEAKDHPTWQQIIDRVEYYQKKVRNMGGPETNPQLVSAPQTNNFKTQPDQNSLSYDNQRTQNGSFQDSYEKSSVAGSSSILKSFKKIPNLIGKSNTQPTPSSVARKIEVIPKEQSAPVIDPIASWAKELPAPKQIEALEARNLTPQQIEAEEEKEQLRESYSKVVSENDELKQKIEVLEKRNEEQLAELSSLRKEMVERMVPKKDFDELKTMLAESVPKTDYEKICKTLEEMVPKARLRESENYAFELETRLQNSISRTLIDQVAEFVKVLVSTSSLDLLETPQKEKNGLEKKDAQTPNSRAIAKPFEFNPTERKPETRSLPLPHFENNPSDIAEIGEVQPKLPEIQNEIPTGKTPQIKKSEKALDIPKDLFYTYNESVDLKPN
jgi:hypothetical protein